jgi:hypothetical protein
MVVRKRIYTSRREPVWSFGWGRLSIIEQLPEQMMAGLEDSR